MLNPRKYLSDFLDGASSYLTAVHFIFKHKLFGYFLIPGMMIIFLIMGFLLISAALFIPIKNFVVWLTPWEWGDNVFGYVGAVLATVSVGLLVFFLYKYIILIMNAPFLSRLSERIEEIKTGKKYPSEFTWKDYWKGVTRGLRLSWWLIWRELLFVAILTLLGFLPVINIAIPFLILLVQSYYAGVGNLDFALERRYGVKETIKFGRKYRFLSLGNGLLYILMIVSIVGLFFAPTLSVTAATLESLKRKNL